MEGSPCWAAPRSAAHELRAKLEPRRRVHVEHPHCSPPRGRPPHDHRILYEEVLVPHLAPGVEEEHDDTCVGIDPREVRPFVEVVMEAGQSEVVVAGPAAVLARHDVVDVEGYERDHNAAACMVEPPSTTATARPRAHAVGSGWPSGVARA